MQYTYVSNLLLYIIVLPQADPSLDSSPDKEFSKAVICIK